MSYCECGHLFDVHLDGIEDDEEIELNEGELSGCTECDCETFTSIPVYRFVVGENTTHA